MHGEIVDDKYRFYIDHDLKEKKKIRIYIIILFVGFYIIVIIRFISTTCHLRLILLILSLTIELILDIYYVIFNENYIFFIFVQSIV